MKKIILLLLLFFTNTFFFAQTESNSDKKQSTTVKQENNVNVLNSNLNKSPDIADYVFNVRFHVVKNDDGSGDTQNIGEDQMMNAMKILNTTFNRSKIYFKYRGFDVIHSTTFNNLDANWCGGTTCPINTFGHLISESFSTVFPPNLAPIYSFTAINIFIVSDMYLNVPSNKKPVVESTGLIAITDDYFLTNILVREIGHYFLLKNIEDIERYSPYNAPCELVNGSNGYTAGDGVADTPATPYPLTINNFSSSCTYVSTGATNSFDCTGVPYVNVPVNNFMIDVVNNCNTLGPNYEPVAGLGRFTNGQISKIRAKILEFVNTPGITQPIENALTTVLSLHQPYAVTTLPNGSKQHKFQKGFTYLFADANQTPLPALNANTSVTPVITNITADYHIQRIVSSPYTYYPTNYVLVPANFVVPTITSTVPNNRFETSKIILNSEFAGYPLTTTILESLVMKDLKLKESVQEIKAQTLLKKTR